MVELSGDREQQFQRALENQSTINRLLRLSLSSEPLVEILDRSLDIILSISWLQVLSKGAIFLSDADSKVLALKAQRALAPELMTLCARVAFGRCLCGKAAASKQLVFAPCVDAGHEIHYDGMAPHGHYNVPILDEDSEVLGVLALYLKDGHRSEDGERQFLRTVADTLALVIKRKQAETQLRTTNYVLRDRVGELERTRAVLEERSSELLRSKQKLEYIAYFDELTGLANRAHCKRDLAEKTAAPASDSEFAIVLIELDNLKRVNDTLGHRAGDFFLQTLGKRLSQFSHEFDEIKVYKWGGDEFVALIGGADYLNLELICQDLTDLMSLPLKFGNAHLRPTPSIGVARFPADADDFDSLIVYADLALYSTKERGRHGYQFFTSEMKQRIDFEARIEQELQIALEQDQLELHFQPQLDNQNETITGLEALIRWNHPERGLVLPGEFLAVAEATGLASAVAARVFDKAMLAVRTWVDSGIEFGRLAINLSPQHLKQGSVREDLLAAMYRYSVEPHLLTVEFLESFLFDDRNADIFDFLRQLRNLGVHIELDDFGTGYASLSHLSTMPIHGLKIDRSFIRQMLRNSRQRNIVSTLVSISEAMKLRVVCEGVETRQQAQVIEQMGNCSIQGYYIARPMSFADISAWITNKRNIGILKPQPNTAQPMPEDDAGSGDPSARCA